MHRLSCGQLVRLMPALGALALATQVAAQEPVDWRLHDFDVPLRPIEQAVGDVGPLNASLRQIERGLLTPTSFAQVYPVPGMPGWLMRIDGAMHAVFKQSIYSPDGPLVPPGTIFSIGMPTHLGDDGIVDSLPQIGPNTNAVSTRVLPKRADMPPPSPDMASAALIEAPANEMLPQPTIVTHPRYREERLRTLMLRAAKTEMSRAEAAGEDDAESSGEAPSKDHAGND